MRWVIKFLLAVNLVAGAVSFAGPLNIAHAQVTLAAAQTAAVQEAVQEAIDAVNMQDLTGVELDTAMSAAISNVTITQIDLYGAAYAGQITSIVISIASGAPNNIVASVIGAGLGQASVSVVETDPITAAAIADALGNSGIGGIPAFNLTVIAAGRNGLVTVAGTSGQTTCDNPSCT